jgi:hypothetical protein
MSSPLNLTPATQPLPKFKDHLPRFSGNGTINMNEHLVAFYFSIRLKKKIQLIFFYLSPKILSTWEELVYWFNSTYG